MILFVFFISIVAVYSAPQDEVIFDTATQNNVLFNCPTKSGTDFVLWFRKDEKKQKDVELGFSERYFFPSLKEVEIRGVKTSDAGEYNCKTPFSQVVIKRFLLKMIDSSLQPTRGPGEAPRWVLLPSPHKVIDNSRAAIIPCRASGKNVITKAFRLKESGEISHELPQTGVVLHRPKAEDSGKYLCTAENSGGKISHTFELSVRVHGGISEWQPWGQCDSECGYGIQIRERTCTNPRPANNGRACSERSTERQRCRERSCSRPRLIKFGYDMTGGNLKLDCLAKGIPTPRVQWKFNGGRLDTSYNSQNATMVIPKKRARSGSYSCTVRNDVGYFTMYITIDVVL